MTTWESLKQERGPRGTIRMSLAYLSGKEFNFKNCPEILAMVRKADGIEHLEGAAYDRLVRFHEQELRQRLAPETTLNGQVEVVERYLDSLPREKSNGKPFAEISPLTSGWGGPDDKL